MEYIEPALIAERCTAGSSDCSGLTPVIRAIRQIEIPKFDHLSSIIFANRSQIAQCTCWGQARRCKSRENRQICLVFVKLVNHWQATKSCLVCTYENLINYNTIMKTIIPILAMMFLVGCRNNSTNQSNSTNSASSDPPAVAYPGAQEVYVVGYPPAPMVEVVPPSPGIGFI
jgi:hypothetical protein